MTDKKTSFITKAILKHLNKYDYSKVVYINSKTKVCIICPEHGEFWQTPNNHLKGSGCSKCSYFKLSSNKNSFIEKSMLIHGAKYNYDLFVYSNATTKSIIICPIHGEFLLSLNSHLSGHGCPKCAKDAASDLFRKPIEHWIKEALFVHGDKYDYSKVLYKTVKDKVLIICKECGNEFQLEASAHILQKLGCPVCARRKKESKGELLIRRILIDLGISFLELYKVKDVKRCYILDFYIEYNNSIYVIEYNGLQHYNEISIFGGKDRFEKQVVRDNALREYCNTNNYKLLEIKYDCKDEEIYNLIKNLLCL